MVINLLIIKGFIIGIGKIIPGISGSILAISMGIYDKIISSFANFFKDVKRKFIFLIQIFLGIFLAIVVGSKIIYFLINHFYTITIFTILGFILGTIPSLIRKTKYNKKNIIISITSFLLTFTLNFFKINLNINISTIIILGIIESFTSIVPGISGTAIFINLGVYNYVLKNIGVLNINFLIFYIIGIILGLIVFTKLINFLLEKHQNEFLSIINGLVIASIFTIFKNLFDASLNQIIIGIILLIISSFISYLNTWEQFLCRQNKLFYFQLFDNFHDLFQVLIRCHF